MSPLFYVFIFAGTVLAVESLYYLFLSQRADPATIKRRLQARASAIRQTANSEEGKSILRDAESFSVVWRSLEASLSSEGLRLLLYRAGVNLSPKRFLGASVGLSVGGWMLASFLGSDPLLNFLGLGAGALPWLQMKRLAYKRMRAFETQLPAGLELITRALRAGNSLTFALAMVGEELSDPIGTEFGQVAEEVKLGKSVEEALSQLAYRINVGDIPFFVTAVSIQHTTGGNLAEILDNLSSLIRERFKLYGKIRALTAIGVASANLLAVWPIIMLGGLYLVAPDYLTPLWEHPMGSLLMIIAVVLVVIGYILCRRMAVIKV